MDADEPGIGPATEAETASESADGRESETEAESGADDELELSDLDPNAEEQARKVDRQLRRLQREMRG